ncbi:uncharacterized protein G2W53_035131 [Senna tora]|uniref:Uncharacterized protein n=1 Tax=Senna tora TaxID=362788 RepID=A0A834SPK3_9FABA|nr:uncharacterized protein G2W53_035131 [Senna tora]
MRREEHTRRLRIRRRRCCHVLPALSPDFVAAGVGRRRQRPCCSVASSICVI